MYLLTSSFSPGINASKHWMHRAVPSSNNILLWKKICSCWYIKHLENAVEWWLTGKDGAKVHNNKLFVWCPPAPPWHCVLSYICSKLIVWAKQQKLLPIFSFLFSQFVACAHHNLKASSSGRCYLQSVQLSICLSERREAPACYTSAA